MKPLSFILAALAVAAFGLHDARAQVGQSLELTGTLRDFADTHPDMQYPDKHFGLRTGIVQSQLGSDGRPVLNTSYNLSRAMIDSEQSFSQWYRNVEGVNQSIQHTIVLEDDDGDGIYRFEASKHNGKSFFPLDGKLYGNEGRSHNYHFTYMIHTKFTYTDPSDREAMTFSFSGDDDVWVYINNHLVVDIGGVHSEEYDSVNVDNVADDIGLETGKTYDFHFFFAERHTTESNFTIETSIQFLSPLYD
ncbi:MAG: fibro-slime domain-containing protein [Planctomycetes bacterium]|jgi:fibro-slime domain-containing protein|nr:fibro-slime domain-containing protein [Planctomycetota bacterium]